MSLSWDDLSHFTWEEWDRLGLTWADMENLSTPDLIALASIKLERFQHLSPEKQAGLEKALPWFQAFLTSLAASAAYDVIKSTDWSDILRQLIRLLS